MPRPLRTDIGDYIYHSINRANARLKIFKTKKDFQAFENKKMVPDTFFPLMKFIDAKLKRNKQEIEDARLQLIDCKLCSIA